MGTNSANILQKLRDLSNNTNISVYVPSLKREVNFKQLSVKQQKNLMKTGLDGALSGLTLSIILNDIITDNSTEVCEFLVSDRIPIILALRNQSFGSVFTYDDEDGVSKSFDISDILANPLVYKSQYTSRIGNKKSGLFVDLSVPNLAEDKAINEHQLSILRKKKDHVDAAETIGSMFVFEICKFVSKLTVNEEEVDIKQFSPKDRESIVENIPATTNNDIMEYIKSFRNEENEYITVKGNVMPFDARLFSK